MASEALVIHGDASTCSFLSQVPAVIDIDQRGDRVLHIGTNKCEIDDDDNHQHTEAKRFRVSSHVLSQLSPVFRAMFFGRFREADQEIVELPDDDPEAMKTLLHIAHLQFGPVYEDLDRNRRNPDHHRLLDDVYRITVVANKYLAVAQLRPWVSGWTSALLPFVRSKWADDHDCEQLEEMEKLLYVSSELGCFPIYKAAFFNLASYHSVDRELFSACFEPQDGVKDQILCLRLRLVENILGVMRDFIDNCMDNNAEISTYNCSATGAVTRVNCRLHTLGVIMRHLKKKLIFPLPEAEDIVEGAGHLHNRIDQDLWSDRGLHRACAVRTQLSSALWKAYEMPDIFDHLPTSQIFSLSSRASEFGILPFQEEPVKSEPKFEASAPAQSNSSAGGWGGWTGYHGTSSHGDDTSPWGSNTGAGEW